MLRTELSGFGVSPRPYWHGIRARRTCRGRAHGRERVMRRPCVSLSLCSVTVCRAIDYCVSVCSVSFSVHRARVGPTGLHPIWVSWRLQTKFLFFAFRFAFAGFYIFLFVFAHPKPRRFQVPRNRPNHPKPPKPHETAQTTRNRLKNDYTRETPKTHYTRTACINQLHPKDSLNSLHPYRLTNETPGITQVLLMLARPPARVDTTAQTTRNTFVYPSTRPHLDLPP